MCSKVTKQFKQRLENNKGRSISGEKSSSIVVVEINEHLVVAVDRRTVRINENEIKELVTDLFNFKRNFTKEEKIELSKMCDTMIDLEYIKGTINNNIKKAHFRVA